MKKRVPNVLLASLSDFINVQMGLFYPKERWLDLLRAIKAAAKDFGFDDVEECIHWLLSSPLKRNQIEVLATHLTVGETYFFREKKALEAIENHILRKLIPQRRESSKRLRIWSAGCCSGEEPYSIAIMLHKLIPDLNDWDVTILATDINPLFLKKATNGIYRDWSFRGTPLWVKEKYFNKLDNGTYEIHARIKRIISFAHLNLAENTYPSVYNDTNSLDMILCRNVLMYFSKNHVRNIVSRFYDSLIDDGWLVVGPSESSHIFFPQYVSVNFPGAILFRKDLNIKKNIERFEHRDPFLENRSAHYYPDEPLTKLSPIESKIEPLTESTEENEQKEQVEKGNPYEEALQLYASGSYEQTVETIGHLLKHNRDDTEAMILLAKTYANQGNISEALKWCEKAIVKDKLDPEFYHLRAVILHEHDQVEEAKTSLKRALYLDPNFLLAHFMLGNITHQQGKIEESDKYFNNVLSLLSVHDKDEVIPEADGMTAGRLIELIHSVRDNENAA